MRRTDRNPITMMYYDTAGQSKSGCGALLTILLDSEFKDVDHQCRDFLTARGPETGARCLQEPPSTS